MNISKMASPQFSSFLPAAKTLSRYTLPLPQPSKNVIIYSSTLTDTNSKLLICSFVFSIQITFEGDRTVVELYKFLKKHASIPFKLKKPHVTPSVTKSGSTTDAPATESKKAEKDLKDEL
jgi:hypothetical protein